MDSFYSFNDILSSGWTHSFPKIAELKLEVLSFLPPSPKNSETNCTSYECQSIRLLESGEKT